MAIRRTTFNLLAMNFQKMPAWFIEWYNANVVDTASCDVSHINYYAIKEGVIESSELGSFLFIKQNSIIKTFDLSELT